MVQQEINTFQHQAPYRICDFIHSLRKRQVTRTPISDTANTVRRIFSIRLFFITWRARKDRILSRPVRRELLESSVVSSFISITPHPTFPNLQRVIGHQSHEIKKTARFTSVPFQVPDPGSFWQLASRFFSASRTSRRSVASRFLRFSSSDSRMSGGASRGLP